MSTTNGRGTRSPKLGVNPHSLRQLAVERKWYIYFHLDWIGDDEFAILRQALPTGSFNCAAVASDGTVRPLGQVGAGELRSAIMNTVDTGFAATDGTFDANGSVRGGTFVLFVSDDNDIGLLAGQPEWIERYARHVRELPHADAKEQFRANWDWTKHETGDWYRYLEPVLA